MNWLKILFFCPLLSFGQLVPPPSGSSPVNLDTVSGVDTSLFTLQIPSYLNGSSVKLRRVTLGQVAEYVSNVYPGCDSACQAAIIDSLQVRFGDSISVPYLHATDSAKTPILNIGGARFFLSDSPDFVTFIGNMIFHGGVGFFGKTPTVFVPCELPYATPPNPVTSAQARADYDLALQNCLDESGLNLVNTP